MKIETKLALFLLLLSPAVAELLTASCPPLEFFHPLTLLLLLLLYGCGTLLIREARVQWRLQWGVMLLGVAYAILEEGVAIKTFFNPDWKDMASLSGYGMYFRIQWPWTIMLIVFHATMSTLIPIAMIDLAWPSYKERSFLSKRGIVLCFLGVISSTVFGVCIAGSEVNGEMIPFRPDPMLHLATLVIVILLIFLARKTEGKTILTSKTILFPGIVFGISGFFFMAFTAILPFVLAENVVPENVTLAVQGLWIIAVLMFVYFEIYHKKATARHHSAFISGTVMLWIALAPIHELKGEAGSNPTDGMLVVGIISLVLLILWNRKVLKSNSRSL